MTKEEIKSIASQSIAEFLRVYRAKRCMSQEELADAMNVSKSSVANWEQRIFLPPVDILMRLADEEGTSIDLIVGRV